jgi:Trypsin-like peptidase domain
MPKSHANSRTSAGALFIALGSIFLLQTVISAAQDLNTTLMNSTFELTGPALTAGTIFGTVFFMGKPIKGNPTKGYSILITAAHVLDGVKGEDASLMLRRKNPDGTYSAVPHLIKLRKNGKNLYVKHPDADVAAMYVALPADLPLSFLPLSALADDARLLDLEVHPGDDLLCLGFPLASNFNTFPVIRSGPLASYPLTPSHSIKIYYYNFHVFQGNSGGPVYFTFSNRVYKGATNIGIQQGVIGLVSQQLNSTLPGYEAEHLDMAEIVPSSFIIETIALLPDTP